MSIRSPRAAQSVQAPKIFLFYEAQWGHRSSGLSLDNRCAKQRRGLGLGRAGQHEATVEIEGREGGQVEEEMEQCCRPWVPGPPRGLGGVTVKAQGLSGATGAQRAAPS